MERDVSLSGDPSDYAALRRALADAPALSVRQPWAELILLGRKTVELRKWTTRYRGWIWLHTGRSPVAAAQDHFSLPNLFLGGFVGAFQLRDIVSLDHERWEHWRSLHMDPGTLQPELFGWMINGFARLVTPVPAPGSLGLFAVAPQCLGELLGGRFVGEAEGIGHAAPQVN
jgi:hypothetical protein